MNTAQQAPPTAPPRSPMALSREQVDSQTMQTRYKAGYGVITVTSRFAGDMPLGDLLFGIIRQKQAGAIAEREKSESHICAATQGVI